MIQHPWPIPQPTQRSTFIVRAGTNEHRDVVDAEGRGGFLVLRIEGHPHEVVRYALGAVPILVCRDEAELATAVYEEQLHEPTTDDDRLHNERSRI